MRENLLANIELFKVKKKEEVKEEKKKEEQRIITFHINNRIHFSKPLMKKLQKEGEDISRSIPIYIGYDKESDRIAITLVEQPEGQSIGIATKTGAGSVKKFISQYDIPINNKNTDKYYYIGTQEEWLIFDKKEKDVLL